ncbi:histidinol-phosphate transaminase [Aquabacterium sp.]|uniref:histidinol-phosphate transaminase n=1 Tax=Aquabacterium sp. TaxID=1872578 RepID=UPI0037833D25
MSRFWSPVVHGLSPYVPGEQPAMAGLLKLNTNENPYPPSPRVLQALQQQVGEGLRLYPEPTGRALREALARREGLAPEQVFVGNGSDEVLALAFMALLNHAPRPLLLADIGYAFYPVYCGLYGVPQRVIPLREDFGLVIDDYLHGEAGAIVIANPNAPTGRALPRSEIARLLAARPDVPVLVDEAYVDFGAESAVPLVAEHPNLLVVQTLSKSRSLAGLRVGWAMGQAPLIEALVRVKDSFNSYPLDRLAQAGALAAIEDEPYFERTRLRVIASRERLSAGLQALGFEVLPSQANFVFARHAARSGAALAAALRERAILVRRFAEPARIAEFLRISIGTDAQCDSLLAALQQILETPDVVE